MLEEMAAEMGHICYHTGCTFPGVARAAVPLSPPARESPKGKTVGSIPPGQGVGSPKFTLVNRVG
jgi:hypothetical protein